MQLRKFYGRTMSGTLAQVRRELGPDALILETHELEPGSAVARMNPGARFEVCAVREPAPARQPVAPREQARPAAPGELIEDLGRLRAQLRRLLEGGADPDLPAERPGLDLSDYHELIESGIDHRLLAPHFRRWLDWRTAPASLRAYMIQLDEASPAARMRGESLREWIWWAWRAEQGLLGEDAEATAAAGSVMGLVGPTGGGKTTTLAKLASRYRREGRQNIVIATLDACRFGAVEQWRRVGRLIGVEVQEIATQEDLMRCMETWGGRDWVGIDTPGVMDPDSAPGRLYGSILARCPQTETCIVWPLTHRDEIGRRQMAAARALGARRVLFSKLDEAQQSGSILNLTMDQQWKIDSFATGTRVPEDLEAASAASLWRRVLAPAGVVQ